MKTAVKTFTDASQARSALDRLRTAGFANTHLYARGASYRELIDALQLPDDAARRYVGELEHGRHLVGVRCEPARLDDAVALLENRAIGTTTARGARDDTVVPIVEERLKVGKHAEKVGGAHVSTHVETERVEEPVTLREESVKVERRDVNERLTPDEADRLLRDRDIHIEAVREEPVVEKEARVVGEVAIDKDVHARQEKVTGTLRHTEVDVDRGVTGQAWGFESEARRHFDSDLSGQDWNQMRDAYHIGWSLGDDRSATNFDRVESEARSRWNAKHDASLWPYASRAMRHAFDARRRDIGTDRGLRP